MYTHPQHGLIAHYLGGFPEHEPKRPSADRRWFLRWDADAFVVTKSEPKGFPSNKILYTVVRREPWAQLRHVLFEPTGQKVVRWGAIIKYGAAGGGATTNTTLIRAAYSDGEALFESDIALHLWRAHLQPVLNTHALAASRTLFEPLAAESRIPDASGEVLEQIAKLGELRDAGVLTEEEFATHKRQLLSRLSGES